MLDELEDVNAEVDLSLLEEEVTNLTGPNLSLACGLLISQESIDTVQVRNSYSRGQIFTSLLLADAGSPGSDVY